MKNDKDLNSTLDWLKVCGVLLIASINKQVVMKNYKDLNSTLDCLKVCGVPFDREYW